MASIDLSSLPPHIKIMILGNSDEQTRQSALKIVPDTNVLPVQFSLPSSEPHSLLNGKLNRIDLNLLNERGYIVIDNIVGEGDLKDVIEEVQLMKQSGILQPASMAGNSSNSQNWKDSTVRGDVHLWIHGRDDAQESTYPGLAKVLDILDNLRLELNEHCDFHSTKTQTQVACYPGGGARYARHLDAKGNGENERRITCLFYLNMGWKPENGGQLRIFLPKSEVKEGYMIKEGKDVEGEEIAVDVEPIAGRLLIFQSRTIPHEVLPSQTDRMAITMWFY